MGDNVKVPKEVWEKTLKLLRHMGDGFFELSHLKVEGEYRYYKTKAREILQDMQDRKK